MFESKKCRRCGKGLKDDWVACPYCGEGARIKRQYNMLQDIDKEFERIDKIFGPILVKFPKLDMENPFKSGGISITIKNGTGMKPQVDVKTAGQYKKIEPDIKKRIGVGEGFEDVKEEKVHRRIPKTTEEPDVNIQKEGNKETIKIKLPNVKNPDDIEIKKLEQSIEIKAFAGDKAYFKLIPIKPDAEISDKSFKNGVLKLEVME